MERATVWSPEVEEAYRIQGSGWRSIHEYRQANGDPARWENGMVKMTVHPKTGFFSTSLIFFVCVGDACADTLCADADKPHCPMIDFFFIFIFSPCVYLVL